MQQLPEMLANTDTYKKFNLTNCVAHHQFCSKIQPILSKEDAADGSPNGRELAENSFQPSDSSISSFIIAFPIRAAFPNRLVIKRVPPSGWQYPTSSCKLESDLQDLSSVHLLPYLQTFISRKAVSSSRFFHNNQGFPFVTALTWFSTPSLIRFLLLCHYNFQL